MILGKNMTSVRFTVAALLIISLTSVFALDSFTATGNVIIGRDSHNTVALPNGKLLMCGGYAGSSSKETELFNPGSNTWAATGSMADGHGRSDAVLLNNGKVLIAGGDGTSGISALSETYDYTTGVWSTAALIKTPATFLR